MSIHSSCVYPPYVDLQDRGLFEAGSWGPVARIYRPLSFLLASGIPKWDNQRRAQAFGRFCRHIPPCSQGDSAASRNLRGGRTTSAAAGQMFIVPGSIDCGKL